MDVEVRYAPRSTYFSPAESRAYYGRYSRDGITIHWWGDGTGAANHDNIVNYFLRRTDGSTNYVLSDNKITCMVDPDNVAWTSQSGNATTISIEHQPTLVDAGYKRSGWLVNYLEKRYGKKLQLYPHKHWYNTACPGTIDLNRIRQEADRWASGAYGGGTKDMPRVAIPPETVAQHYSNFTQGLVNVKPTDGAAQNRFEDTVDDEFWYGLAFQLKDLIAGQMQRIPDTHHARIIAVEYGLDFAGDNPVLLAAVGQREVDWRKKLAEYVQQTLTGKDLKIADLEKKLGETPTTPPVDPDSIIISKEGLWAKFKAWWNGK